MAQNQLKPKPAPPMSLANAQGCVAYVMKTATQGNPDEVLRAIDQHSWEIQTEEELFPKIRNVGDKKGEILDRIVKECNPKVAVELGGLIGYSAVRIAKLLGDDAKLYSIEMNPNFVKLSRKVIDFAGLDNKVTTIEGSTDDVIPKLKEQYGIEYIDFVFIDHENECYLADMKRLLETGLFRKGTVVAADNMIFPGCPDYKEFVENHPKFHFETFDSNLEYFRDRKDAIGKCVYLG